MKATAQVSDSAEPAEVSDSTEPAELDHQETFLALVSHLTKFIVDFGCQNTDK